jgi:hypothetical protein
MHRIGTVAIILMFMGAKLRRSGGRKSYKWNQRIEANIMMTGSGALSSKASSFRCPSASVFAEDEIAA